MNSNEKSNGFRWLSQGFEISDTMRDFVICRQPIFCSLFI